MSFESKVAESFKKAREDAEGIKNELAFALRRVAKIEETLTKMAILEKFDRKVLRKHKSKKKKI